ncbi:MAG: chromate efflux transporter [Rhodobacteraceae bacterium]|nr:chromate efflux transporter [Paracoccaceae bacterium]
MTPPSWTEMLHAFGRIGLLSFGGPAAQIALMHETLVERHKWLDEKAYLSALSLCMLLPGPEAMQLATYAGWRLKGVLGGLLAGLLFVIPGAICIAALAALYLNFGQLPLVQAAFLGVKATVIIIVFQALRKLAAKALTGGLQYGLAVLAFAAIFALAVPFPLVVIAAGVIGAVTFTGSSDHDTELASPRARPLFTFICWGGLWSLPFVLVWLLGDAFLLDVATFFSKLAVVTFGGAYAVLAYMTQQVVQDLNWITTPQMIDALGLAETTPGPLILVTEFVAILAGAAKGGLAYGILAGVISLWVTFVPCFLWIFLAGPYVERIDAYPRLSAALKAITAAVVGVILNLSVWFALHVLFGTVSTNVIGPIPVPDFGSLNFAAIGLTALAGWLILRQKMGLIAVLAISAAAAAGIGAFGVG